MIISFASGKGGTGKTTVATNYALLLAGKYNRNIEFLDCDVEEPNAGIFLKPKIEKIEHVGIPIPKIDRANCDYCGVCADVCAYNALAVVKPGNNPGDVLVFSELCHGCGGCMIFCPKNAISETDRNIGIIEKGKAGSIKFMQGKLKIGEPMATPLIRQIKEAIADDKEQITLIDVPPGTSCPVIEAVKGSDLAVLVTEPTPFGLHDLVLAVDTLKKLAIPMGVVINRSSSNDGIISDYCHKTKVPVLMELPLSRAIAVAYSKGEPIINLKENYKQLFMKLHQKIAVQLNRT